MEISKQLETFHVNFEEVIDTRWCVHDVSATSLETAFSVTSGDN